MTCDLEPTEAVSSDPPALFRFTPAVSPTGIDGLQAEDASPRVNSACLSPRSSGGPAQPRPTTEEPSPATLMPLEAVAIPSAEPSSARSSGGAGPLSANAVLIAAMLRLLVDPSVPARSIVSAVNALLALERQRLAGRVGLAGLLAEEVRAAITTALTRVLADEAAPPRTTIAAASSLLALERQRLRAERWEQVNQRREEERTSRPAERNGATAAPIHAAGRHDRSGASPGEAGTSTANPSPVLDTNEPPPRGTGHEARLRGPSAVSQGADSPRERAVPS